MATYPKNSTMSGARARFLVKGNPVGWATGVSGSETIEYEPAEVIGMISVPEYQPVAYRCELTASFYRIVNQSFRAQGIMPKTDLEILTASEMTCVVQDIVNEINIAIFEGVKFGGASFDFTPRGLVIEQATFVATRMGDETAGD